MLSKDINITFSRGMKLGKDNRRAFAKMIRSGMGHGRLLSMTCWQGITWGRERNPR